MEKPNYANQKSKCVTRIAEICPKFGNFIELRLNNNSIWTFPTLSAQTLFLRLIHVEKNTSLNQINVWMLTNHSTKQNRRQVNNARSIIRFFFAYLWVYIISSLLCVTWDNATGLISSCIFFSFEIFLALLKNSRWLTSDFGITYELTYEKAIAWNMFW